MSPVPTERAERLTELVAEHDLEQLIVGDLVRPGDSGPDATADSRWLTGFTGTSALAIVGPEARIFITDFRYVERAEREVGDAFEHVSAESRLLPHPRRAPARPGGLRRHADQRRQPQQARAVDRGDRLGRRAGRRRRRRRPAATAEGSPPSRRRSRRRHGSPTRPTNPCSPAASSGAPSARSPGPRRPGSASSAPSRRFPRSSARGRTAPSRTPSRPTARSAPVTWSVGHGRGARRILLGLHPHVRGRRARRGRAGDLRARPRRAQAAGLEAVGAGRRREGCRRSRACAYPRGGP